MRANCKVDMSCPNEEGAVEGQGRVQREKVQSVQWRHKSAGCGIWERRGWVGEGVEGLGGHRGAMVKQ